MQCLAPSHAGMMPGPVLMTHCYSYPGEDYMAYNRRRWGSDGWTRCAPTCKILVKAILL